MYVAPRPKIEDDPLFAVRIATGVAVALLTALMVQATLPTLMPAIIFSLLAGMRKAFDPKKGIIGPIALSVIMALFSALVSLVLPMPLVLVLVMGGVATIAYYLILRTGNPIGMLLLVGTVLMSVMGMNSVTAMNMMRDAFVEAGIAAAVIIPVLYVIFPAGTNEQAEEDYTPAEGGQYWLRAMIRGVVLMALMLWLYSVIDASNIILVLAAVFVLVFPSRKKLFAEAWERTVATMLGGCATLVILVIFYFCAHPPILLGMMFLVALFFAHRMMSGHRAPMVYQFAGSVMIALTISAIFSSSALSSIVLRIVLTLTGAMVAAFVTSLLEALLLKGETLASSS